MDLAMYAVVALFVVASICFFVWIWNMEHRSSKEYEKAMAIKRQEREENIKALMKSDYQIWPFTEIKTADGDRGVRLYYKPELPERGPSLYFSKAYDAQQLTGEWRTIEFTDIPAHEIEELFLKSAGGSKLNVKVLMYKDSPSAAMVKIE